VSGRGWPYALGMGLFALGFVWLNRGETMALHLGAFTWYRAPVAPMLLAAFLLGMATMVLAGMLHERRGRAHAARTPAEPPISEGP
jgi:hypothetical protein